jgi:CelD/BcsL family acetyltransferase involved in cellulose biosynthesis
MNPPGVNSRHASPSSGLLGATYPAETTTRTATISVEILDGQAGTLPEIEQEWVECLRSAPEHQQLFGYHWYSAWLQHLAREDGWTGEIRLLLARDGGKKLLAILPLAKRRFLGVVFWGLAGYYQPHRGYVCLEEHRATVCAALARALLKMQGWRECLRFGPYDTAFPERRLLVEELARRSRRQSAFNLEPTIVARDIPQSLDAYHEMVRSHSSLWRARSYLRRMEREGNVEIRHYRQPLGDELRGMLADCAAVEQKSWLASDGEARPRFLSPASRRYWEHVCAQQFAPRDQLNVWVAYFNGEPVAFRFTVTTGSILYAIANQYDQRFERYRLGWILNLHDLEDCATRGVRSIDMGTGKLSYQAHRGGREEAMNQVFVVWPPGPVGHLATALAALGPIHRRIRRRI